VWHLNVEDLHATGELIGGSFYGLIGTYLVFNLGRVLGHYRLPQGTELHAIVPYLDAYLFQYDDNLILTYAGSFGPPTGALVLFYSDGTYTPAFGTAIGQAGYPPVLHIHELGSFHDGKPIAVVPAEFLFVPYGTACQAYLELVAQTEPDYLPMIAKYPTATLAGPVYERFSLIYDGTRYHTYRHPRFGSAGVIFAAALPEPERSRYRSYFPTAEDFLDGEWVCLPREHEILGTFVLEHIGTIIGFGQTLIPLVSHGTHVAYGRLYFKAISEKWSSPFNWQSLQAFAYDVRDNYHWFHAGRFKHFDGVIMPGGWVKCAFLGQIGSVQYTANPPAFRGGRVYLPSKTLETFTTPVIVLGLGSARLRDPDLIRFPFGIQLRIDECIAIPRLQVVTYQTGEPLMQVYANGQYINGAYVAIPQRSEFYPEADVPDFYDTVAGLIKKWVETPAFMVIVDAHDGPFVIAPMGHGTVKELCDLLVFETLFGPIDTVLTNLPDVGTVVRIHLGGWIFPEGEIAAKGYNGVVLARPHYGTAVGNFIWLGGGLGGAFWNGVIPYWDIDPRGIGITPTQYHDPSGYPHSMKVINNRWWSIYFSLQVPWPQWTLLREVRPKSYTEEFVWRLRNDFLGGGPIVDGSVLANDGTIIWVLYPFPAIKPPHPPYPDEPEPPNLPVLKFVPLYYASVFAGEYIYIPWNRVPARVRRRLIAPLDQGRYGYLQSLHLRIDVEVDKDAIAATLPPMHFVRGINSDGEHPELPTHVNLHWPKSFGAESIAPQFHAVIGYVWYRINQPFVGTMEIATYVSPVYHSGEQYRLVQYLKFYEELRGRLRALLQTGVTGAALAYYAVDSFPYYQQAEPYHRPETIMKFSYVFEPPRWYGQTSAGPSNSRTLLSWTIYPAPAPFVPLGVLTSCGSFLEFANWLHNIDNDFVLLEPIDRWILANGTTFLFLGEFAEIIAIYRGKDWSWRAGWMRDTRVPGEFIRLVLERDNVLCRWPAYWQVNVWEYDNPVTSPLFRKPPYWIPIMQYYFPPSLEVGSWHFIRQNGFLGSALFAVPVFYGTIRGTSYGRLHLVIPAEGWKSSLPVGRIEQIPSHRQIIATKGSFVPIEEEDCFMRRIITMGNNRVILYPTCALYPGSRVVYYFTQYGGRCPLWMHEPIIGVDGVPLDNGKIFVTVFTTRGVISFKISADGVEEGSWDFAPVPEWYRKWIGTIRG
jgi:hypothetical protein